MPTDAIVEMNSTPKMSASFSALQRHRLGTGNTSTRRTRPIKSDSRATTGACHQAPLCRFTTGDAFCINLTPEPYSSIRVTCIDFGGDCLVDPGELLCKGSTIQLLKYTNGGNVGARR